jgi:hypothetical protein
LLGGGGGGGPPGTPVAAPSLRRGASVAAPEAALPGQLSVSASAHKIGNELLRQHFRELTCAFLKPLELYGTRGFIPQQVEWSRLPPSAQGGVAAVPIAWMQTFDRERFLRELALTEPAPLPRALVSRRADLVSLYRNFTDTPHFRLWWHERRAATLRSINQSFLQAQSDEAARRAAAAGLAEAAEAVNEGRERADHNI